MKHCLTKCKWWIV